MIYHQLKNVLGLSFQLAKANFKLRNEGSYLGILWYLLDPLLLFIILLFISGKIGEGIENYPLYLLLGLIIFNFFRKATTDAATAINRNDKLINSLKINQEVFVISVFLQAIFAHIFEMIVFVGFLLFFNISILNIIYYPLIFIFLGIFTLGLSFILAGVGVYVNDLGNIWSVFNRLLWFATPIFYSEKIVMDFNIFNPIYYFITTARKLIVYQQLPEGKFIMVAIIFSLLTFIVGFYFFEKTKNKFAEKL